MHMFACPDLGINRLSSKLVRAFAHKAEVSRHHIKDYSFFFDFVHHLWDDV